MQRSSGLMGAGSDAAAGPRGASRPAASSEGEESLMGLLARRAASCSRARWRTSTLRGPTAVKVHSHGCFVSMYKPLLSTGSSGPSLWVSVRDGRLSADRCTQPSRGASDAAVPGGCSLAGPEQPAMQPSAGEECSDQPPAALGWGVLLGLPESAPRCSLAGWSTGTLGHWGAGARLRRSKRAARAGRLCTGWSRCCTQLTSPCAMI